MGTWQFTPFAGLYVIAALVCFLVSYKAFRMRPVRGTTHFSLFCLSSGIWALSYLLGFFNTNLTWKLVMLRVEYLGINGTFFFWIIFTCVYINHENWLKKWVVALLAIMPVSFFVLALTVNHHNLLYRSLEMVAADGLVVFIKVYGPAFYIWVAYSYSLFALAMLLLVWHILRMPRQFRRQSIPILVAVSLSLCVNYLYISGNNPIAPYDPTPLTFAIVGTVFIVVMRRYRFLDIVPVAYNLVFENAKAAVVIVDERRHVLDMNPAAQRVFGRPQEEVLGKHINDGLSQYREVIDSFWDEREQGAEIHMGGRGGVFELQITPMSHKNTKNAGHVIMLFDISKRKQMEQEQKELISKLEDTLGQVKALSGLLPICAACKKIRDDEGYWHQVEEYITKHSDTEFSHGMCPDCLDKMYGDSEWYADMKDKKRGDK